MARDESAGQPSIESDLIRDPNERHATREFVADGLNDEANVEDSDGDSGDWPGGAEVTREALSRDDGLDSEEELPSDVIRELASFDTLASSRDEPGATR